MLLVYNAYSINCVFGNLMKHMDDGKIYTNFIIYPIGGRVKHIRRKDTDMLHPRFYTLKTKITAEGLILLGGFRTNYFS